MIRSFGNTATDDFYNGRRSAHARSIASTIRSTTLRKLDMVNAALTVEDLRSPPGNRLEKLSGNFRDFHSIRINNQWRIIFKWVNGAAEDVEIVDYHR